MERKENSILLRGTAAEVPVLSHRSRGLDFYRFPLEVPRLSGQEDRLNVLVPGGIFLPTSPSPEISRYRSKDFALSSHTPGKQRDSSSASF